MLYTETLGFLMKQFLRACLPHQSIIIGLQIIFDWLIQPMLALPVDLCLS